MTGRYGLISKTFHGTARAADSALRDLIDQQAPAVEGVGATFGQLLDQWLEECERLDLSPTTLRTYRAQIKRTIRPRLGKVPLTTLTAKHLDDLYGAMKAGGKSTKTIRNHHAVISAALHQACPLGMGEDERCRDGQASSGASHPGECSIGRGRPTGD